MRTSNCKVTGVTSENCFDTVLSTPCNSGLIGCFPVYLLIRYSPPDDNRKCGCEYDILPTNSEARCSKSCLAAVSHLFIVKPLYCVTEEAKVIAKIAPQHSLIVLDTDPTSPAGRIANVGQVCRNRPRLSCTSPATTSETWTAR